LRPVCNPTPVARIGFFNVRCFTIWLWRTLT
jgi:hypothetical protein